MAKKIIRVAPSLLAADFLHLDKEMKRIISSKANWLHLDIMDGSFVNNISYGTPILQSIKDYQIFKDVHLMIQNPDKCIKTFVDLNADLITFHYEAIKSKRIINKLINTIHEYGLACGISIKPNTPVSVLLPYLKKIDVVLVMSVEPGFGGQKFEDSSLDKIKELRNIIDENGYICLIEVDGGINDKTAKLVKDAGVDVIVSGSYLFKSDNMKKLIKEMKAN